MKCWRVAVVIAAGFVLAGCGVAQGNSQNRAAIDVVAAASTTQQAEAAWPPAGMTDAGDVAWQWTSKGQFDCETGQGICWGVTVVARNGCPRGVYVEIGVTDGGVLVSKANDITAGLGAGRTARVVLSPPRGAEDDARANVSQLNCLG